MTHLHRRCSLSKVALCYGILSLVTMPSVYAAGVLSFSTEQFTGDENDTLTITIVRSGNTADAVSVVLNVGIAGTATFGTDFDITLPSGTVDFADGETFQHVTVDLLDDSDAEGLEFATLALSTPSGGATVGNLDATRLEIRDDESSTVQVSFGDTTLLRVAEGDTAEVVVSKTGTSTNAFTVDVNALAGTAAEAVDYTDPMAMLSFAAGDSEDQTLTLFTLEDDVLEGDEGLDLVLFISDGAEAVAGEVARAVLIEDDEPNQPGAFALEVTGGTSVQESAGTVSFTISRAGGSSGAASVDFVTVDGTQTDSAAAGTDYEASTGTVSFADGQTSQTFGINIIDDTVARSGNRQFDVLLANPLGGAIVDPDSASVTLSVQDNDGVPDDGCVGTCDCFIATAAYGSYLDPHVDTLRAFRDDHLSKYALGRAFVAWYYETSPEIAARIAHHEGLRFAVRLLLTPVVYGLEYPNLGLLVIILMFLLFTARRFRTRRAAQSL